MAPFDPDVSTQLDQFQAEVHTIRALAGRAEALAAEAMKRVTDLRSHVDVRFTEVDERIDNVAAEVLKAETRLACLIEHSEVNAHGERVEAGKHRQEVVKHVTELWRTATVQHQTVLQHRQAMGFYAVVIVAAILMRGGCGG